VAQDQAAALSTGVRRSILMLSLVAALGAGCGSSDGSPSGDDSDTRAGVLACLTEEKGLDAREEGDEEIVVDGPGTPRIRFYLTAGEAEAAQFEGDGEGAEQIGAALLFVKPQITDASEELLSEIEECLADQ
jgi:hypothetical protein